jgi:Uma2 family endonuclease
MTIANRQIKLNTEPLLLDVRDVKLHITPAEFDRLSRLNRNLRLELTKDGELIVMPPTGGETGRRNSNILTEVVLWNRQTQLGEVFDSSTGYDFTSLGGGIMSPDVSWIAKSRLAGVDLSRFIPVVPDFAIELRSQTDSLQELRLKMKEYRYLGVRLGWLINPQQQQVEIYRQGIEVEISDGTIGLSGEDILPGFVLSLATIW